MITHYPDRPPVIERSLIYTDHDRAKAARKAKAVLDFIEKECKRLREFYEKPY